MPLFELKAHSHIRCSVNEGLKSAAAHNMYSSALLQCLQI